MSDLPDRDMAVIFKADARDYMIAAESLRTDDDHIWLVAPTYFLRSHAIELLLKAVLLANGQSLAHSKQVLGHRLVKSMEEAEKAGLVISDQTKSVIRTLSPLHEDYTFRYRPSKPYAFPNQKVATDAVAELFEKVNEIVALKCVSVPAP